jgi:hypothetical protein
MSGVSTITFGGAVRIAARPYRMGNGDDIGIPILGDGLMGVMGVRGMVVLKRPLLADPPGVAVTREG